MNKKTILSSHFLMRAHIALALITVMVASPQLFAQQLNILVLGSTHSYSEREIGQAGVAHEKPFNPGGIASQLQSILAQDAAIAGTVNVTFEDIFKTKQIDTTVGSAATIWDLTYYSYSLIQHFMWPEGKDVRLADLRGEGTVAWDYIVLCEDPYIMANFPGMFAEGVKMIQNEVAKSASPAQVILLAQWPENSSGFSAGDFNEVVYRVGDSAGLPVVPSGKAWDAFTGQDTASAHPTPKGEYLAASAIYSRIFDRSAATSAYTYNPGGDAIANHAFSVVQANDGVAQYAGKYTIENPFQMKYYRGRQVDWNEYGTSTEEGFAGGLNDALSQARVGSVRRNPPASGNPVDLSYSRGNDWFEPEKQYRVDPAMHDRVHGFPMGDHRNTGPLTMRYGIDKRYYRNSSHSNGTDLGIAYSMVREGEVPQDVRGIPVRLMWAKINHFRPEILAYRDSWHLSRELDRAVGAYMFTLLTGRCPVEAEPAEQSSTAWQQWFTRKLGYETAWQMAHLTTRAPGFRVLPSATNATTITPGGSETMTVQFVNPPQQEVTVSVSISNSSAAIVGPQTLVFTPANYNIPQQVTVAGIPGATAAENFEVAFSTTSTDEIYDGLSDAWGYTINRSSTVSVSQTDNGTQQVLATQSTPVEIQLGVTGADAANTTFAGPANGSISWTGPATIEYTPTSDYLGSDYIAYAVTIGGTQTLGAIDLSVQVPNGQVNASASDAQASEEGPDTGSFVISRLGDATGALDIFFTLSGTATPGEDYTLSHTSPVTLPDGQSSVTLTLTPVDDTVFGEHDESVILSITPDAAYPIGAGSASITIADNDNRAPLVDAGADQTITLLGGVPWSPDQLTPQLWLDADDSDTVILNGSTVSQWSDKSGNNRHAIQSASATAQPTLTSAGLNGKNVLNFDGNSDYFDVDLDFMAGMDHSTFIVTRTTSYTDIYGAAGASSGANSLHVGFSNVSSYRMNYWSNDWNRAISANFDAAGANLLNFHWVSDASKEILANGQSEGNIAQRGIIGTMSGGGRISNVVGHGYYGGDIAEFIAVTGPISLTDRQKMEGYLAHKWGLAGQLAGDHPHKAVAPGGAGAVLSLNGSASDPDGDSITATWSFVSAPVSIGIDDPTAVNPSVTFSQAGTYVLRLTVSDGQSQTSADITITVSPPPSVIYTAWAEGGFANAFTTTDPGQDQDGDGMINLMEFAFGTDPTLPNGSSLATDGSAHGLPGLMEASGGGMDLVFVRRDDHGTSGSVSYTAQFSSDLGTFYDSALAPTVVTDSSADIDYEVVKVAFPATLPNGQPARFARLAISDVE